MFWASCTAYSNYVCREEGALRVEGRAAGKTAVVATTRPWSLSNRVNRRRSWMGRGERSGIRGIHGIRDGGASNEGTATLVSRGRRGAEPIDTGAGLVSASYCVVNLSLPTTCTYVYVPLSICSVAFVSEHHILIKGKYGERMDVWACDGGCESWESHFVVESASFWRRGEGEYIGT